MNLVHVLAYENEDVVHRFAEDFSLSFADSQEIFLETKRWLWLCAKRKKALVSGADPLPLFNEAYAIDMMWHTFLLFTEDYADFCQTYFGFFLHHSPKPRKERLKWQAKIAADPNQAWAERRESLERVYSYLYDELGPDILVKWCEEFPSRFKNLSPLSAANP